MPDDLPPSMRPGETIPSGESRSFKFEGDVGTDHHIQFSGIPSRKRLVVITPGGSSISVPVADWGAIDLVSGTDAGELVLSITLEEQPNDGLQLVR